MDWSKVESIGGSAFYCCSNVVFGALSLPKIGSVGSYAFEKCYKLTAFSFPDSLKSIGDRAFADCSGLKGEIRLGPNVASVGKTAFGGCHGITNVVVDSPIYLPNYMFGWCANIESVTIGDNVKGLGSGSEYHPFRECPKIASFSIGKGITSIPSFYFGSSYFTARANLTRTSKAYFGD